MAMLVEPVAAQNHPMDKQFRSLEQDLLTYFNMELADAQDDSKFSVSTPKIQHEKSSHDYAKMIHRIVYVCSSSFSHLHPSFRPAAVSWGLRPACS